MAEKFEEIAVVVDQSSLGNGIYDLTLKTDKIAKAAKAGQFVSVYSNDKSKLLPRPISLCGINRDDDTIRLVYRVTGEGTGTEEFSKLVRGDKVRILGPLGNGFTVQPGKKAFLIGGGIGVPPMLQLAKDINAGIVQTSGEEKNSGQAAMEGAEIKTAVCDMNIVMGYRDENTFLLDEFKEQAASFVATEDGSVGTKGNVIDAIKAIPTTNEFLKRDLSIQKTILNFMSKPTEKEYVILGMLLGFTNIVLLKRLTWKNAPDGSKKVHVCFVLLDFGCEIDIA